MRLGAFALRCQLKRDYADLEQRSLEEWLRSVCGDRLWEQLWRPLLDSKFDGRFDDLPATYLWARSRRMAGDARRRAPRRSWGRSTAATRSSSTRWRRRSARSAARSALDTDVRSVAASGGRALGVVLEHGLRPHDWVATTQLRPAADRLLAPELSRALGPDPCRYLGVVCLVLRAAQAASRPYYALNITDRRIPLTTVVETTHVVDPERVGGTLALPAEVRAARTRRSSTAARPTSAATTSATCATIFPALDERDVLAHQVARARVAEPVHVLGGARPRRELFPVAGLAMASSAHVYPELVNGQAMLGRRRARRRRPARACRRCAQHDPAEAA